MPSTFGRAKRIALSLCMEPPSRLFARKIVKHEPFSIRTKAAFQGANKIPYLLGVLGAADEARAQGVPRISVLELGVAGGNGLVALQNFAAKVEADTGVGISVFGFDAGGGISTAPTGDYRDHPDRYQQGDFPMDEARLRARLSDRTTLILGDVAETLPRSAADTLSDSLGFVAVDIVLYSSTKNALNALFGKRRNILLRVPLYLDDINGFWTHRWAGELLAVEKFNRGHSGVKIDVWHRPFRTRPFPEEEWVQKMYVAHDLAAISALSERRPQRWLDIAG